MTPLDRTQLETSLRALGELLDARGLHYEVVLIGGGNLILRGLVTRPTTKDLDLLGEWTADGGEPQPPTPPPPRPPGAGPGRWGARPARAATSSSRLLVGQSPTIHRPDTDRCSSMRST